MKKLMLTAAAAAMAGAALAEMPAVYDYKANVKHMYLKEVNATIQLFGGQRQTVKVYQKYQKSSSLKGYLIHDVLGATSRNAVAGYVDPAVAAPIAARVLQGPNGGFVDKVNNRAFLVVMNSSAEAQVRQAKILPAVLEAKFFDQKFQMQWNFFGVATPVYTSGVAEGTLFVGGDLGVGVKPYLRNDRNDAGNVNPTSTGIAALGCYWDYGWTSIYLWGKYNGAQGAAANWANLQNRISALHPVAGLRAPATGRFFHDTWMNGAGIGKFGVVDDSEACCGFQVGGVNFGLDNLAGNLKGGLFLCSENGYTVANYAKLGGCDWEDQFWNEKAFGAYAGAIALPDATAILPGDLDLEDVWIDGDVEQFTTDVLYGDWSIKRLATARVPYEALSNDEIRAISGVGALAAGESYASTFSRSAVGTTDNTDLDDLNATIKGAARQLSPNIEYVRGVNGTSIMTIGQQTNNNRFTVPFMAQNFALAYGLGSYARGAF